MLEHTEPVIMICPNYSQFLESSSLISVGRRRQLKRVLQVEYFISQSGHAFSTGTQATKIQLLDVEGVDFEEAVQVMVPIKLAANTSHVRLRVSMCTVQSKVSYVDPSSCYVSFDVVVKVVYGDQVPLTKSAAPWHPMMATMGSRDVFGYALKMMGHNTGTFVEVGVNRGRFAKLMLTQWDGNRYLMVDPWTPAPSEEYVDIANAASAEVHNEVLKEAIRNVLPFGKRPVVIRDTSVGAATWMVNASVDVVYIDGLHHYAGVMDDIEAWWPKLKRGGVMAGHDYYLMSESKTIFTVKPAVDEFMRKMGLVVFQTQDSYPTWFVMKE
ncbi:unnamed protein product [Symbiodinium microadriaticum]|nr:unnamed protein product [Symbiodinium microadriaticum]